MAFCPYVMTGVRRRRRCRSYKARQSYISRMVWPRITKFDVRLHARPVYNHTGNDVTMYFWSEVIEVRKNGRKWRLRRLQPTITKTGTYIHTDILINHTGYDVTEYFRLAVIEVKKNGRKCCIRRLCCCISREPLELESPGFTCTSMPICPTFAPDMASLTASGRKLQQKKWKMQPQTASGGISWERFMRDHQISHSCWG